MISYWVNTMSVFGSKMEKYQLKDLEKMSNTEFFDFIDGIADEQAQNSEYDGDSDADDAPVTNIATPISTRSNRSCSNHSTSVSRCPISQSGRNGSFLL